MNMKWTRMTHCIGLFLLGVALLLPTNTHADNYSFTKYISVIKVGQPYLIKGSNPIPAGETATYIARVCPSDRSLKMTIKYLSKGVRAEILKTYTDQKGAICVLIKANEETQEGHVILRAEDQGSKAYSETRVDIGAPVCSIESGDGDIDLSSIDACFRLGKAEQGRPAGNLYLYADIPSLELATPKALKLSALSQGVEALEEKDGTLRQVAAPETIVDILVINEFCYELRFYRLSDVIKAGCRGCDHFYEFYPEAQPMVIWKIENPDSSSEIFHRLRLSQIKGVNTIVSEYVWDNTTSVWSLTEGNGLRVKTRDEEKNNDFSIVTETVKDATGKLASIIKTTFYPFPWGEDVVKIVEDPNGAALTTIRTYFDDPNLAGSYGRIESQLNPDGSWERYEYDDLGRCVGKVFPWLDSPITTPAGEARYIRYDYMAVDQFDVQSPEYSHSPRTVVEEISGNIVSLTYYAYLKNTAGDTIEMVERCTNPGAAYGNPANERIISVYHSLLSEGPEAGRIKSLRYPDGRLDTYIYESGKYTPNQDPNQCLFEKGEGKEVLEVLIHGTIDHQAGIAFKTTKEIRVLDAHDNLLRQETFIYTGEEYERIDWMVNELDDFGHVVKSFYADGTQTESTWECCGRSYHKDRTGIETEYIYDELGRLTAEIKTGMRAAGSWPAQSDITTLYTYDAEDRLLSETLSAGGLNLASRNEYDLVGRKIKTTDQAGLVTSYTYDPAGGVDTIIKPGGATEITSKYKDGQIKSITGTGGVPQYFEYGVNADCARWTKVYTGRENSPLWEKKTVDLLGRISAVEKPGFGGTTESTRYQYNQDGQLIKTEMSGQADMLYEYDALGNQVRSGLDVTPDHNLDPNSNNRLQEAETYYTNIDGIWWQETIQRTYAKEQSNAATVVSIQRNRLTDLGGNSLHEEAIFSAESIHIDINGNQTIERTFINQENKTVTRIVDLPESNLDEVTISVNGLLMSSQSKSGLVTTYEYDALGRKTGIIDPRTGKAMVHYNSQGQVDYSEDAAGNRTTYVYDPATGMKVTTIDSLGNKEHLAYDQAGQITHTWGEAVYPVKFVYDLYGRRVRMFTYRLGTNWSSDAWPTDTTGQGDETLWVYDEATGLLMQKLDAAGKGVSYTYTTGGKLVSRTWARLEANQPIVTTYSYDTKNGELLRIDYSDSTPDLVFTYNRLGQQKTITDALGTRTFTYNEARQLQSESIEAINGNESYTTMITRTYTAEGIIGRPKGFSLGDEYKVTYGYDQAGRFTSVGWEVNSLSHTANYSYLPDSDLIQNLAVDTGLSTTYTYEDKRDLRTLVKNEFQSTLISHYGYQYDTLGRRTSVANTGQSFEQVTKAFNLYNYNTRNELIESSRYMGADITRTDHPVQSEYRNYTYDHIGNRTQAKDWFTEEGDSKLLSYSANALNQYSQITSRNGQETIDDLTYDDDGNLTLITTTSGSSGTQYKYDAENRLIAVIPQNPVDGDKKVEFAYDYMSRRVIKKAYTYQAGAWSLNSERFFIYDDWNMVQEIVKEGDNTKKISYVWGLDLSGSLQEAGGIGGLLCRIRNWDSHSNLYCYDGNGNVGQMVDTVNGAIVAHYEYDPYGNEIVVSGSVAEENTFRFSTKYWDGEVGLYYYGYRYYKPVLGRWLNRDPMEEKKVMDEDDFFNKEWLRENLYLFVRNDVVNSIDPYGLHSYTVKKCTIEILVGHWSCIPERIENEKCSAASVSCCWADGGVDTSGKNLEWRPSKKPKERLRPQGRPPIHKLITNATAIVYGLMAYRAGIEFAQQLCKTPCSCECSAGIKVTISCHFGSDRGALENAELTKVEKLRIPGDNGVGFCGRFTIVPCNKH